ncbi:MAG TPA: PDZ domain-containing protein, partial [Candidatus Cloacimonadota bacterium]|nr:PDZ domain-containing protein [Candidatus Cloacimonadota bacterium]
LVIVDIREHSLALTNGLRVGDIITNVNSNVVQTEDDLSKQLAWGIKKQPIVLDVIRKQKHIKVNLNLTNNKIRDFKNKSDEVYIIGPDIYDSELYIYSQGKINQILKQSDTEIESEIQRLESEIQGLKKRIRNK